MSGLAPFYSPSNASAARRDSRNTLEHHSGVHPPLPPRILHIPNVSYLDESPGPSIGVAPPLLRSSSGTTSPAASVRSAVLSYPPQQTLHPMYPGLPYAGTVMSSRGFAEIPTATSDNDYLGFCKGAWKVQNGDRKGAMEKSREAQSWSRNAGKTTTLAAHLRCQQSKCAFRSNYISSHADLIWDKVIIHPVRGMKLRWRFLAKSHVPQKVVFKGQYAFKCLICVYMGQGARAAVYVGTEIYLDHIDAEHRDQHFHDVLLYKVGCIHDRVAEDDEDFDINLWPLSVHRDSQQPEQYLSDDLLGDPAIRLDQQPSATGVNSNEPWVMVASDHEQPTIDERQGHYLPAHRQPHQNMIVNSSTSPPIPPRSEARLYPCRDSPPQDIPASPPGPACQYPFAPPIYPQPRFSSPRAPDRSQPGLTACLNNILHIFSDGNAIIDQLKANPAVVHLPLMNVLDQLLQETPHEMQREWQRGVARFGAVYETGDDMVITLLSQTTAELRNSVVQKLRRAVYWGEPTDLAFLADSADLARQRIMETLYEYGQRLMHGTFPLVNVSIPSATAAAMQQAQDSQQDASLPQKHILHMRPDDWKDPYIPNPATRRHTSVDSNKSDMSHRVSNSTDTGEFGETRRRGSVLGVLKDMVTRKPFFSKAQSPQGSQNHHNGEGLADSFQTNLNIHPALRQRPYHPPSNDTLSEEVGELDRIRVRGAV